MVGIGLFKSNFSLIDSSLDTKVSMKLAADDIELVSGLVTILDGTFYD